MKFTHDFKRYPELTTKEMGQFEFMSPHKQIKDDFRATVVKVHDGDTITLDWNERDFAFPLRLLNVAAPELNEKGGIRSRDWLKGKILGKEVDIIIDKKSRVGKYGRLLGYVMSGGINLNEEAVYLDYATTYPPSSSGKVPKMSFKIKEYKI